MKKTLITITIFCLIVFMSSFVFASNMVKGAENALRDVGTGMQDNNNNGDNNGYTATRTSSAIESAANANNTMVWIILSIVAVIIVALVWYYGTQTIDRSNH